VATLTKQAITNTGLAPSYIPATNAPGDNFTPDQDTFLHVKNGGGSAITVTVATPGTAPGGLAIADVSVSVPATSERMIGPFPAEQYADPAGTPAGNCFVTYSGITSVTVGCFSAARQP
jgi:hypothetical protein